MSCGCKGEKGGGGSGERTITARSYQSPPDYVYVELANGGLVGIDTGHEFASPRTGAKVRVVARVNERPADAIARVRQRHGV